MPVRLRARRSWTRLSAALAGLLTAFAIGAIGQPPTEEEDPNGGVKKKVVVEDDPKSKAEAGPGSPPDVRLDELARGAEEATHPAVKDLFTRNTFPYDRLTTKDGASRI